MDIKNKVVFITGASSGIGKATAYEFAKEGCKIVLTARRLDKIKEIKEDLEKNFNIEVLALKLDVTKKDEVKEVIKSIKEPFRDVDILINNAGLASGLNKIQDGNTDDWDIMIDTNVKGLLYVTRTLLKKMILKDTSSIINVSSVSGKEVYAEGAVYCATKHAVDAITKGLRMGLLGTNVKVSSINPGLVETEFSKVRFKGDKNKAEEVYKGLKPLSPEDIAECIVFMAKTKSHVNIADVLILPTAQASVSLTHRV